MSDIYESTDPAVNPQHYKKGEYEVIDIISIFTSDLVGIIATDTGNIIKYSCRWYCKDGARDVEKILWYGHHLLKMVKDIPEIEEFREIPYSIPIAQIENVADTFAPNDDEATSDVITLSKNIILRAICWTNTKDIEEMLDAATKLRDLLKN